ncbi:MAG: hypothetical protein V3V57_08110 [Spirochaetia bacterium]
MKRIVLFAVFIAVLALPAFSQFRIDMGVDVPLTVGTISGSGVTTSSDVGQFLGDHILPFPEASLYYQFSVGRLKLAPGVRVFTFILESVLWPNLMAELALDPVFIQAQLGGLIFAVFGLVNDIQFGEVLLPDVSVWIGLGKERRFRLGAGVLGMMLPELSTEEMLIIPYVGAKISLLF